MLLIKQNCVLDQSGVVFLGTKISLEIIERKIHLSLVKVEYFSFYIIINVISKYTHS